MVNFMAKKKISKEELDQVVNMYSEYFTEINQEYDDLLKKSKKYLETAENKIDELSAMGMTVRGSQHYLSEHLENASSLISQCQGLADSKYKIKKTVLEYAIRDINASSDDNGVDYTAAIAEIVKKEKAKMEAVSKQVDTILSAEELDDEIDRILSEN